jgi:hypothetical protein
MKTSLIGLPIGMAVLLAVSAQAQSVEPPPQPGAETRPAPQPPAPPAPEEAGDKSDPKTGKDKSDGTTERPTPQPQ